MSEYTSLESEFFDDGTDEWGYSLTAEAYRVGPVDLLVEELKLDVQTWKETASTFEDFYRKTEAELTKARELFADLVSSPHAVMVPLHLWKRVQELTHQSASAAKDVE